MLTPLSALQLDHGLAALRAAQLIGDQVDGDDGERVPVPGEVSLHDLARYSGLSVATIHGIERIALAKALRAMRERDLIPAHLVKRLCRFIDDPDQPELF